MRHDALEARCRQHLRGIDIPWPFSLEAFAALLAARRGRAIRVLPLPGLDGTDGLSGTSVATASVDYVLISAHARGWHRDLIGLHEIAHVLCGHTAAGRGAPEPAQPLAPGLSGTAVRRILGAGGCSAGDEQEAELTAWLILADLAGREPGSAGASAAASLRALGSMRHELASTVPGATPGPQPCRAVGSARMRLIRCTAEIRDATLALRGYVPADDVGQCRRMLAARGLAGAALDAAAEACWLKLAASAARAGAPASQSAHVMPSGATLFEEVAWLTRVAGAMRSAPVRAVTARLACIMAGGPPLAISA